MTRNQKVGAVLVSIGVLYYANLYFRAEYLEFDRQRAAWHERCDAYVNQRTTPETQAMIHSCNETLQELNAYAKRKGWDR